MTFNTIKLLFPCSTVKGLNVILFLLCGTIIVFHFHKYMYKYTRKNRLTFFIFNYYYNNVTLLLRLDIVNGAMGDNM